MTYTTAKVSMLVNVDPITETKVTSLAAACSEGHADIARTLLQCVTPRSVNILCGWWDVHFAL